MNKTIWGGLILAGMLLAGIGFNAVEQASAGGGTAVALPFGLTLLLTGSLLSCLAGLIGLTGLMAWVPGLAERTQAAQQRD